MSKTVGCVVIFIPLLGGIATMTLAVLILTSPFWLDIDPDGIGPVPLEQYRWDTLFGLCVPMIAFGVLLTTLGIINLRRRPIAE
jgi:amino acid transporter